MTAPALLRTRRDAQPWAGWARRERARRWAARAAAGLGLLGLVSALSPPLRGRLEMLLEVLPVAVPGTAVLTLVFVSVGLVLTARGLRRGHRLAWVSAELLLVASVVLHLFKGIDVEEALAAGAGAAWLARQHGAFTVLPPRAAASRAAVLGTVGALVVVAASLAVVEGPGEGTLLLPRSFAQVLAAVAVALLAATAWILLTPREPEKLTGAAHRRERERARDVVTRYGGGSLDYFALRDDKQWFFTGRSIVAHAVRGGVCLVSPDPIGPVEERAECWAEFVAHTERQGWSVAVLGAAEDWLPLYESAGLRPVYLGDEAVVDCATFTLEGHGMKSVRRAHRRVASAGFTATFHHPGEVDAATREQLEVIARQGRMGDAERGFSMTLSRLLDPDDADVLVSVVRDPHGLPVAFAQWVPAPHLPGWSLDVMRRSRADGLPNGVMDFLVVETILHARDHGAGAVGLNFVVLRRGLEERPGGAVDRAGHRGLLWMSGRAQIESLRQFDEKYAPRWVPRYAALGAIDLVAAQGVAMAGAEGLAEIPLLGRLVTR
ncbi:lysyl-tRNA synthetase class 2 [Georgenia soli]|uniref:Lysyl-tRNA synthetase class 2 n=1 Tax=Georgenia soli TaxID=638953 RepID=A0A2A9EK81_9MICO|nr:phosphatidylglycerol lysyltransferase domain-containing protein [Georgenia soli]PFG39354.1 lysyl-tRNA synthetase class 2 [Georgenia soli]